MGVCEVCGALGADCLCVECGRVVCERCFVGDVELCSECARRLRISAPSIQMRMSPGVTTSGIRVLGLLLIVLGFMVSSIALMPEDGEGVIVLFPFVFGNVSGLGAAFLSLLFMAVFLGMYILPWYIMRRQREGFRGFNPVRWDVRPRESEAMEYMITLEVPPRLRKTIYIEGEGGEVRLGSSSDASFHKSYSLPEGFEVDEYNYEYEGDYLVLRLKLKSAI